MAKYFAAAPGKDGAQVVVGAITVSTYKNGNAPTAPPEIADRCLRLTVKQGTMVALFIMEKFTRVAMENGLTILTPLAGAIFPRDSIDRLWEDKVIETSFRTKHASIDAINKSAQNGGQFLNNSRVDIICGKVQVTAISKT